MALRTAQELAPFAWLAVCATAAMAHFWMHPQREFFTRGLRVLGLFPLLPALYFFSHLFAFRATQSGALHGAQLTDWPALLGECARDALGALAWLPHDAARLHDLPTPMPLLALQALAAAALQVWLCLVLPEGDQRRRLPPADISDRAVDSRLRPLAPIESRAQSPAPPAPSLLLRWRGILLLAAIHAFIVAAFRFGNGRAAAPLHFLGVEFLFCFMPLSFAAAHSAAGFVDTGAAMLRIWRAAWLPWLGWAVSAFALLTLLSFALRVVADQSYAPAALLWMAGGLFSSLVHAWLLASCVLLLRRSAYVVPSPSPIP